VDTLQSLPELIDFFDVLKNIYTFISNSNTRHELFVHAQKELSQQVLELERTVPTRWFYWYNSIQKVKLRFEAILTVLDISSRNLADKGTAEAIGLKNKMHSFQFVMSMLLAEKILSTTNPLSQQLQTKDLNIVKAVELITSTQNSLTSMRSDSEYNELYAKAEQLSVKLNIDIPNAEISQNTSAGDVPLRSKRLREVSKKLEDFFVTSTIGHRTVDINRNNNENTFKVIYRQNPLIG
jgi:hypothetical protein